MRYCVQIALSLDSVPQVTCENDIAADLRALYLTTLVTILR